MSLNQDVTAARSHVSDAPSLAGPSLTCAARPGHPDTVGRSQVTRALPDGASSALPMPG